MTYQTDKYGHGYVPVYSELIWALGDTLKRNPLPVLEIGVANGDSEAMWSQLACEHDLNIDLAGVDVNTRAGWHRPDDPPNHLWRPPVMIYADQSSPALPELVAAATGRTVDWALIVDDASHNNELTTATFSHMWPLVCHGGVYVIEDWNHAGGLCASLARDLLDLFRESSPRFGEVREMTYRHGMIIIEKA